MADRLYTMYGFGGSEYVSCHNTATGRQVWRSRSDAELLNPQGNGPRSTPVVDDGVVYALGALGKLHALDAETGRRIWTRDLVAELKALIPSWGVATSPLVEGNLLLVDVGGQAGNGIVAFNKKSGKVIWASPSERAGYSTPVALTVGGERQVVFFTGTSVLSLAPSSGAILWHIPWRTEGDVNAAMPVFVPPDRLFVSSGYGVGAGLFRLPQTERRSPPEPIWKSRVMENKFSSSVLREGILYGFDNTSLKAIEVETGTPRWEQRGFGHGSLILADAHLIVLSERCELALVEATPQAYREKSRVQILSGRCWTAPSLADGRLYLRNEKEIVALDLTEDSLPGKVPRDPNGLRASDLRVCPYYARGGTLKDRPHRSRRRLDAPTTIADV